MWNTLVANPRTPNAPALVRASLEESSFITDDYSFYELANAWTAVNESARYTSS